ncbi:hypothetical protein HAX54_009474 [Datura stramonium]|uniref:Uncharacterized protein n=1 Tax=Datura stramonium TaxID=4076 RepID=A0ABS8TEX0_DATST|nr:hypothetical protein [Datura stramonium]
MSCSHMNLGEIPALSAYEEDVPILEGEDAPKNESLIPYTRRYTREIVHNQEMHHALLAYSDQLDELQEHASSCVLRWFGNAQFVPPLLESSLENHQQENQMRVDADFIVWIDHRFDFWDDKADQEGGMHPVDEPNDEHFILDLAPSLDPTLTPSPNQESSTLTRPFFNTPQFPLIKGVDVINVKSGETLRTVKSCKHVYTADISRVLEEDFISLSVMNRDPFPWPKRPGRASLNQLNKLVFKNLVIGLPNTMFKDDKVYESCARGSK